MRLPVHSQAWLALYLRSMLGGELPLPLHRRQWLRLTLPHTV